jgi:hypothetical protein
MKFRVLLAAALFAVVGFNTSAMANPADEAALIDLEYKWISMSKAHDVEGLNALIDDTYEADTPKGKEKKSDMLMPAPADMAQSLSKLIAKVDGDTATVSGENLVTFKSGSPVRLSFVDKFVRKDGRWRVVSSYVTN